MTVAVFLLLLLGAVPIALVLALTAMWYIQASGNTVLFDSYPQQLFSAIERFFVTSCGFGLIEQAAHWAANQVDHGDEVGLVPVAACA